MDEWQEVHARSESGVGLLRIRKRRPGWGRLCRVSCSSWFARDESTREGLGDPSLLCHPPPSQQIPRLGTVLLS